jgi:hypothetical protein
MKLAHTAIICATVIFIAYLWLTPWKYVGPRQLIRVNRLTGRQQRCTAQGYYDCGRD